MTINIFKSNDGQYYFRISGSNGEPLAHSETYPSKQSCVNTANLIKASASNATVRDLT